MSKNSFRDDELPPYGQEYWDLVCSNCGGRCGYDHMSGPGTCLDKITGQAKNTKFKLDLSQSDGKKRSHSRECPCGIYRGDCEYHK
jgi:hypothetical protein